MDQKPAGRPKTAARVKFWRLPDDLATCFTMVYTVRMDVPHGKRVTDYVIPEWANLRFFSLGLPRLETSNGDVLETRSLATGPSSKAMRFELGSTRLWGLGLHPCGWARFVSRVAADYADTARDLRDDDAFASFAPLCDILMDPDLPQEKQFAGIVAHLRRYPERAAVREKVRRVHEAMTDPYLTEVAELARRTGLSTRTLERLCARHFGFPPRMLLRRQRMMRSVSAHMLASGRSWSETIDRHYHDQAHFVREFHTFMGMTPTQYAKLPHPLFAPIMHERQRVWGRAVTAGDPHA